MEGQHLGQRPDINAASSAEVERYVRTLSPYDAYLIGIERCDCKCYQAGYQSGYWHGLGIGLFCMSIVFVATIIGDAIGFKR